MNESDNLIQETYALLDATLVETLENAEDILSETNANVNYVDTMRAKIAAIEAMYDLTEELKDELASLRSKVNDTVLNAFCKEFHLDKESVMEMFHTNAQLEFIVETIYRTFYMERRSNVIDYLVNAVYSNKTYLIKVNKTPTTRKDIEYYSLRSEMQLANSNLYVLLINYAPIAKSILEDTETSIDSFINNINIPFEEMDVLTSLFECGNKQEAYITFGKSVTTSNFYGDILLAYKESLKKVLEGAK